MSRLYCFTLGLLLLTVRAEKEDFQGYLTEQTKGTTVTKNLLLKKENKSGRGTETLPTENTHQHRAVAVTAKFPGAVSFDTRPTEPYKTTQITRTLAIIALPSTEHFVSEHGQNSLASSRHNPSALRFDAESEIPLISNYEKIIFPSTQAALESMMNGTSEPKVHLSADAVKVPPWLGTLLDNRNQRNTDSVTLTSADGRLRVPFLSASHPRVIDNLTVPRNDNDDKRYQGQGISDTGRNAYLPGTMQSIFQSDTAKDSARGNAMTNVCLTCLTDRREVSTEKSVTLPGQSPSDSSDDLGPGGLSSDLSQLTTSSPSLHRESDGRHEETPNKDISHQNITERFIDGWTKVYNQKLVSSSFKIPLNNSQDISNNFHIKSFSSDRETFISHTRSVAEISPETHKDSKKHAMHAYTSEGFVRERPASTTTLYHPSKSLNSLTKPVKNGEQELLREKVSIWDSVSKLMYFSRSNTNTSKSHRVNFKHALIQNQTLDSNSVPKSNMSVTAETPRQESALLEGSDRSAPSHPAAGTSLIEPQSAITPFSRGKPTASAVEGNAEESTQFESVIEKATSLISAVRSETSAKPSSRVQQNTVALQARKSAINFASGMTKRHNTDKQDSQKFTSVPSISNQSFVDTPGLMSKAVMRQPQRPIFTATKETPLQSFLSASRQDFSDDVSILRSITLSSKSFFEGQTISTLFGTPTKITQGRTFKVISDGHKPPKRWPFSKEDADVISNSQTVHNLKKEGKNELTRAAENKDEVIIKLEDKQDKDLVETRELLEKVESLENESFETKEEDFPFDKAESGKQERIINTEAGINQNTGSEAEEMEEHEANTSRSPGGRTTQELSLTLSEDDTNQGKGTEREGVTKMNRKSSIKNVSEKQRGCPIKVKAGPGGRETSSKDEIKREREFGREEMRNLRYGPTANSRELNRDKEHSVTTTSSCHSLIQQRRTTEHEGIHLSENAPQIVAVTTTSFSYKMTNNHGLLHSILRSHSPRLSKTSFSKEPDTQIKPHLSSQRERSESLQDRAVESIFSRTAAVRVSTSTFKPTIFPFGSATKSAHPAIKRLGGVSLNTPRLAITAGFLRAQPRFTVNSSTLNVSIIYSILDHKHKLSTSLLKADSVLHTTNAREEAEYIMPSINPAQEQQMYNDSSTKTPIVLSSEAPVSIGQLQPHQGQSAPQVSPSSSLDITSGLPCSFQLSKQAAHPHALHVPVDDNKQRSVQTLMASMSPEARNDQFRLSGVSPQLNLRLLRGDSLPGTHGPTAQTKSVTDRKISRVIFDAEYANSPKSVHAESLLGTADEMYPTEKTDGAPTMVTSKAKQIEENNISPLISQIPGESKTHFNVTVSVTQFEQLAGKDSNENKHNDLIAVGGNNEADNTETVTLENNHPPTPVMSAVHTLQKAINVDFVHVMNATAKPVVDTNDLIGTIAHVESDTLPERSKIEADDVTKNAIFDMKHHAKQNNVTRRVTESDNSHIRRIYSKWPVLTQSPQQIADQIMNVTSKYLATRTETNDFMSVASALTIGGPTVSRAGHESLLTVSKSVATEKSSQAAHVVHSDSHIEPFSGREFPVTPTALKLTPAVNRQNTRETQSVTQPDHEISVLAIEHSKKAPPAMIAMLRNINDPGQEVQEGLLRSVHRDEGEYAPTSIISKKVKYYSLQDMKTALTTESASEINTAQVKIKQQIENVLPGTAIGQLIIGPMTYPSPPTRALRTEIIMKSVCKTNGCAKSDMTTKATTGVAEADSTEKTYTTLIGRKSRDNLSTGNSPPTKSDNDKCNSDCPAPEKTTPQANDLKHAAFSAVTADSDLDHASIDETMSNKAGSMSDISVHLERHWTPEQAQLVSRTTQSRFHEEASDAQEAMATEVTLSEPEASPGQLTIKTLEQTLLAEKNYQTQLNRGASQAEIFEEQNATRSVHAMAKGEMALPESGHRLSLPESESELPWLEHRTAGTSPHLHLPGVTEVSDDLCGSGNYTAEMSLNMGRGVEPGDAVPAPGNLRVFINLKTNNSQINLAVTSCCLSPATQPDLTNSTCCLFSRLAGQPAGITLLPSALSTSTSFTISLFQMINYSVVYLHCDLSVCLRNHSDCERQCLQKRSVFSSKDIVANIRNRISFGPMLKQVRNSTFPEEIDPSELDLVLVLVSLVVGSFLVTVMLLLVWLAYRRRAIWPRRSTAPPPRACCGCAHPGGDLILP